LSAKALRSIYLDIEQIERLKKLSAQTKVPQAVYVREGIDFVLNRYAKNPRKKRVTNRIKHEKHTSLSLLKE